MRYILLCFIYFINSTFNSQAQTWGPPMRVPPTPDSPFVPALPGSLSWDQQERTRATNQDLIRRERQRQDNQQEALRELRQEEQARQANEQARQQFMLANRQRYELAYQELQGMLESRQPPSLKRAVFLTENAFLNGGLNYAEFSTGIYALGRMCYLLTGDSARPDPAARFLALHRLMTDTVRLERPGLAGVLHPPPRYDFEDFWGREDFTKQFVSKLLATNAGQCHSMPWLYKLVAEELGIKAYLSMAPSHMYIQVKDNGGALYSYETTNGHFVSDAYYATSVYIKAAALRQRTYLDTLTRRETLACAVFDLADGYAHRYGYDALAEKYIALGLRYYPHSMQGRILAHDAAFLRFQAAWQAAGQPTQDQARQSPALHPLLAAVEQRTRALDELGYEEMPAAQYSRWLQQVEEEKTRRAGQQAATRFGKTVQN